MSAHSWFSLAQPQAAGSPGLREHAKPTAWGRGDATPLRCSRTSPTHPPLSASCVKSPCNRTKRQLTFCAAKAGADEHMQDKTMPAWFSFPEQASRHDSPSRTPAATVDADSTHESSSIDEWVQYASELDIRSAAVSSSTARLERAVIVEDYSSAAKLKAELKQLAMDDVLADVHQQQASAVASDDFAAAARLRDEALQNLTGWWAASNSGSDPWSHVIRVSEGYSRLEARAFSPAHMADVMGWGKETPYHRLYGNKSYDDVGIPYFEVLLKRDVAGRIQQRHFVMPDHLSTDDQLGQSIVGLSSSSPPTSPPDSPAQLLRTNATPPTPAADEVKPPPSLWSLFMNRKTTPSDARTDDDSASVSTSEEKLPSSPGVEKCGEGGAQNMWALKGQLMPRRHGERSPSLREAFEKLEEMDALAALTDLEARTALASPADAAAEQLDKTRVPCGVTLIDRNHFRLSLPGLVEGAAPRTIDYVRLEDDLPSNDPLTGYYLGSFGVHGPELLLLQRGIWDGEEAVIAHKVTGDPNVPAGQVSFRAKVGTKHGMSVSAYPSQLSVSQRFPGEGCVAERGFLNSRWAKGELLSFSGSSSGKFKRLTGNAELGFIWSMAHSKRFLILLSRVNFNSPSGP